MSNLQEGQYPNDPNNKNPIVSPNKNKAYNKVYTMLSGSYKTKKCQYFNKGACTKGSQCTFSHNFQPQAVKKLCKFYLGGACNKGDKCLYSHNTKQFPCKYFHIEKTCNFGLNCKFSHNPINPSYALDFLKENQEFLLDLYKNGKLVDPSLIHYIHQNNLLGPQNEQSQSIQTQRQNNDIANTKKNLQPANISSTTSLDPRTMKNKQGKLLQQFSPQIDKNTVNVKEQIPVKKIQVFSEAEIAAKQKIEDPRTKKKPSVPLLSKQSDLGIKGDPRKRIHTQKSVKQQPKTEGVQSTQQKKMDIKSLSKQQLEDMFKRQFKKYLISYF